MFDQALDEPARFALEAALTDLPVDYPGVQIENGSRLTSLLATAGPIGTIAAGALGPKTRPVRAILFDKTAERNWALAWHQDCTIVVAERRDVDGFGPWSIKAGLIQVEPPFAILERMMTVRVHLEAIDIATAPLRIVHGSHRLGRLPKAEIRQAVARFGKRLCPAERGDVWAYTTPIVHSSRAVNPPRRRRILPVNYSADLHPNPLRWRG